jgi:putative transposase
MVGKRHDAAEITAKLTEADAMAASGHVQHDISKALGISIMTYHRWRKMRATTITAVAATMMQASWPSTPNTANSKAAIKPDQDSRLRQLELENSRLRRILTDLLLERLALTDGLDRDRRFGRFRASV